MQPALQALSRVRLYPPPHQPHPITGIRTNAGEVVLFAWIEHLKERWADLAPQPEPAAGASDADAALAAELQAAELLDAGDEEGGGGGGEARTRWAAAGRSEEDAELQQALAEVAATVVHGEPVTERRSTFQVLFTLNVGSGLQLLQEVCTGPPCVSCRACPAGAPGAGHQHAAR